MKVAFLLKASTAHTAADFSLRQVASTSGRLDVVSRCLVAALSGDDGFSEVIFCVVLEGPPKPPLALEFLRSRQARRVQTETEASELLFRVLSAPRGTPPAGIAVTRESFRSLLRRYRSAGFRPFYLHEEGQDIRDTPLSEDDCYLFILGDHIGLDSSSEKLLSSSVIPRVNVGPLSYLSSHCIVAVKDELWSRLSSI